MPYRWGQAQRSGGPLRVAGPVLAVVLVGGLWAGDGAARGRAALPAASVAPAADGSVPSAVVASPPPVESAGLPGLSDAAGCTPVGDALHVCVDPSFPIGSGAVADTAGPVGTDPGPGDATPEADDIPTRVVLLDAQNRTLTDTTLDAAPTGAGADWRVLRTDLDNRRGPELVVTVRTRTGDTDNPGRPGAVPPHATWAVLVWPNRIGPRAGPARLDTDDLGGPAGLLRRFPGEPVPRVLAARWETGATRVPVLVGQWYVYNGDFHAQPGLPGLARPLRAGFTGQRAHDLDANLPDVPWRWLTGTGRGSGLRLGGGG